jgi:hypothetical protein
MTCQGTPLTFDQALPYALNAGFVGRDANIMTAIAQAESGLCANNTSPPNADGSVDRGPYQINSKAQAWVTDTCAYDWACSAKAAKKIHDNWQGFGAWTTYTTGKYQQYMPNISRFANTTPQSVAAAQQVAQATGGSDWQAQIGQMFSSFGEHIAIFAIALVLVIVGVMMMVAKPATHAVEGAV